MDLRSPTPVPSALLAWQPEPGRYTLTVICKATFDLRPIESPLSGVQEPIWESDSHWNDDASRSLSSASDLVPAKTRAEVLVVGHAYAPQRAGVRSLVARVTVGTVDKRVEVFGDRTLTRAGVTTEPGTFVWMPLRWEKAAGGQGTDNPAGVLTGRDAKPDVHGGVPLPNLSSPGVSPSTTSPLEPIGLGPIAPTWPSRWRMLGGFGRHWRPEGFPTRPLPRGFERGFFNCAPADQQLEALQDGLHLRLESLHAEHAVLTTRLARIGLQARVDRANRATAETLPLRCDTLWIDTDRAQAMATFRVDIDVQHSDEPGLVTISRGAPDDVSIARSVASNAAGPPWRGHSDADVEAEDHGGVTVLGGHAAAATLPFMPAPNLESWRTERPPPLPALSPDLSKPLLGLAPSGETLGPWARSGAGAEVPMAPAAKPVPVVAETPFGSAAATSASPAGRVWKKSPSGGDAAIADRSSAPQSAVGFSNDAADPRPQGMLRALPVDSEEPKPDRLVDLFWHDPLILGRVRKKAAFKELLSRVKPHAEDEDVGAEAPPERRQEARDRRDMRSLLARAVPTPLDTLRTEITEAVRSDGGYAAPLVVLAGELRLDFDEVEMLKATIAAVAPFAKPAKAEPLLKEAFQTAEDLASTPWIQGASGVAEAQTEKLRSAFAASVRGIPAGHLESQVERSLIERRAYPKREAAGMTSIRGVLSAPEALAKAIAVYLPAAAAVLAPCRRPFAALVCGELRLDVGLADPGGFAVRVWAVAQVVGLGRS